MPTQRRSLAAMPGTFDCPEASATAVTTSNPSGRQRSILQRVSSYTEEQPDLQQPQSHSHMDDERHNVGSEDLASLTRRIRAARRAADGNLQTLIEANTRSLQPHWPTEHNMHGVDISSTNLHRHRLQRQREDDEPGTVQDALDRLNEASALLRSNRSYSPEQLANDPLARILSQSYESHRPKRRKLDADPLDAEPPPVYGHYGQVVPGRLKMSIISCDGGYLSEKSDPDSFHHNYWPENILKNDKSVYCTEKHHCNIMLSHAKETPFTLTKIVIKAPDQGFTAPLQEGLVFISMNSEGLLSRTDRYRLRSSLPPRLTTSSSVYPESHGHHDGFARPYIPPHGQWWPRFQNNQRPPSRRHDFPAARIISPMTSNLANQRPSSTDSASSEYNNETVRSEESDNLLSRISLPPGYKVTVSCEDPSEDEEEPSNEHVMRDRDQRQAHLGFDPLSLSSSDEDFMETRRYRRRRHTPRKIELGNPSKNGNNDINEEVLAPHARFFIEHKRNVVNIKFDPPISGRYVLLKLWSPHGDRDNIDVQSVSVFGFAGTRFVPAIKFK